VTAPAQAVEIDHGGSAHQCVHVLIDVHPGLSLFMKKTHPQPNHSGNKNDEPPRRQGRQGRSAKAGDPFSFAACPVKREACLTGG
jgi:hypothetical protein